MEIWLHNYKERLLKVLLLGVLCRHFGDNNNLFNKCILSNCSSTSWWDLFLYETLASLLVIKTPSTINFKDYNKKFYNGLDKFDYVNSPYYERTGIFEKQFDVIHLVDEFYTTKDDLMWQKSVANICFYLKDDGIAIITGDMNSNEESEYFKSRSEGVWKAVLNKYGCKIVEFGSLDPYNTFHFPYNYLVVKKDG